MAARFETPCTFSCFYFQVHSLSPRLQLCGVKSFPGFPLYFDLFHIIVAWWKEFWTTNGSIRLWNWSEGLSEEPRSSSFQRTCSTLAKEGTREAFSWKTLFTSQDEHSRSSSFKLWKFHSWYQIENGKQNIEKDTSEIAEKVWTYYSKRRPLYSKQTAYRLWLESFSGDTRNRRKW